MSFLSKSISVLPISDNGPNLMATILFQKDQRPQIHLYKSMVMCFWVNYYSLSKVGPAPNQYGPPAWRKFQIDF